MRFVLIAVVLAGLTIPAQACKTADNIKATVLTRVPTAVIETFDGAAFMPPFNAIPPVSDYKADTVMTVSAGGVVVLFGFVGNCLVGRSAILPSQLDDIKRHIHKTSI